jgi:hypothetical protein
MGGGEVPVIDAGRHARGCFSSASLIVLQDATERSVALCSELRFPDAGAMHERCNTYTCHGVHYNFKLVKRDGLKVD